MTSNILIKGVSCNVLYLFYEGKVMQTGLGRNNWRGVHKQQPRKDVELYFFSHNSTNTPPVDLG